MARRYQLGRQLGRPPSTTSGRIAVTISEAMKLRASLWSLRNRVPLAVMVEEGLALYMARERAKPEPEPAEQPPRPRKRPPPSPPGVAPTLPGVEPAPEPEPEA